MQNPLRRFQFSLRTLFVVVTLLAIPCGWLGWQTSIVRERAEVLDWLSRHEAAIGNIRYPHSVTTILPPSLWWVFLEDHRVSWYRKLFGDHYVAEITYFADVPADDLERLKAAFPEALIQRE